MTICCNLETLVGQRVPFYRALALEYGEGRALTGLVFCREHQTCYRFIQLDNCDELVAYGLYKIPTEHSQRLLALYGKVSKPKWPLWIAPTPAQIRTDAHEEILDLENTIWSHGKLDIVMAAENIIGATVLGISQPVLTATRWLSEIGL